MEPSPTNSCETKKQADVNNIVSDDKTKDIMFALMLCVTPIVSLFGVTGNFFSILILFKQGLKKCSNILLFVLAISDITYLVSFNSPSKIIYHVMEDSFPYSEREARILFVSYSVLTILDYSASPLSLTLPMLITLERLIVIFFPFRCSSIITPIRTWVTVLLVAVYWLALATYLTFWFDLEYTKGFNMNSTHTKSHSVGLIVRSELYQTDQHAVEKIDELYRYTCMWIPSLFTVIGCVIIALKVKQATTKREKMTSNSYTASVHRTTRMLLAVCAMYCVTTAVLSLPAYIPQYASYSLTEDAPSNIHIIMYQVMNIVICLNSSCNFLVYICLNKNFRDTYKQLLKCK